MLRRFREHELRPVCDLRGVWDFAFLGDVVPEEVAPNALNIDSRMSVPGCFDATPAYAGRRGLTAYRLRVPCRDAPRQRLLFDGVHHWSRVFVNGRRVRDHVGGFTRFTADFPTPPSGEAEIVVLVDNRFSYQRCPLHLDYFDWYHYGGIARGVELHGLTDPWIERLEVVTTDVSAREVRLRVRYGTTSSGTSAPLVVALDGATVLEDNVQLPGESGEIERTLKFGGAALWSPETPNLHLLHVRLGEDDMCERIGLRQVRTDGQELLINDQPVRICGFGRHEFHPQFGHGGPESLLVGDAQILKDMGANFVRGAHYPQDMRWLDLCDEMGLLVWSEGIAWQHKEDHLTDPHFLAAQLAHLDEMVAWTINRPSVVMWGTLNECDSDDPKCRPAYEKLLGHLRDLDPSRPVTFAGDRPFDDVCLDLVDIVSVNWYPGWYEGTLAQVPDELDKIAGHLDAHGCADKPLLISEIGAGGIWGWRDWHKDKWSEQYQAALLDAVLTHLLVDRDRWLGVSIWQFCDVRSSEATARALGRPRSYNNKGIVDEYRRPKMAYDVVRRYFQGAGSKAGAQSST